MFPLRDDHNEAFRKSLRKDFANQFVATLEKEGYEATHEPQKKLITAKDQRGYETRFYVSDDGLIERSVTPEGVESRMETDEQGRLIRYSFPSSHLELERDQNGIVKELKNSDGASYKLGHDQQGRLNLVQHPDKKTTEIEYDPVTDSPIRIKDRAGQETHIKHERNRSTTTDPLGRQTVLHVDQGRLNEIEFPDESTQSYEISEDTNLLKITRRDGSAVFQEHKEATNSLELRWPDGKFTSIHRDEDGKIAFGETATTDVIYEYDDAGELISEETPDGTIHYESDEETRVTKITTPVGIEYKYEYDGDGRLGSITAWNGQQVEFQFDENGLPKSTQFPNGVTESVQVKSFGRLAKSSLTNAEYQTLSEQSFTYNSCEKLIGIEESWSVDASSKEKSNQRSIQLQYDDEFRVLSEKENTSGEVIQAFQYDAKGNLISQNGLACPIDLMDGPTRFGNQKISYDGLGNMTQLPGSEGTIQVVYGGSGVVDKTICNGCETHYEYGPFGRRIRKTSGDQVWKFGWSDHQLLWEEHQASPASAPVRREYLYLPQSFIPVGFHENGRTFWMHTDARGAVTSVTDETGKLVWRATYDSFGTATVQVDEVRQPFRMAGQYFDSETGLHYNFTRYYSPHLNSYLSIDPQWHRRSTTKYSYCRNDPWNLMDPTGGHPVVGAILAGAAVVCVGAAVGAGIEYATGGDPWAGAIEGGFATLGSTIGVLGGPAGIIIGGLIGGVVGVTLGTLVRAYNSGTPLTLECLWRDVLWAIGMEVGFTLATLGLSRIPIVGTLFKKLATKLDNAFYYAKGKLGQWTKGARDYLPTVESLKPAKTWLKKMLATEGIAAEDMASLRRFAAKRDEMIIVRQPNPESLQYHGVDGYRPKPLGIPGDAKTDETGLVKWIGDGDPPSGKQTYDGKKFTYDSDGYLRDADGNQLYSDYDLQGSYNSDGTKIDTNSPAYQEDINGALGSTPNDPNRKVQHGANDNYEPDGVMGRQPDPDETYVVVHPNGMEEVIHGTDDLQQFYSDNGMEWPYNNYQ